MGDNLLELYATLTIDTSEYEKGVKDAERSTEEFGNKQDEVGEKSHGFGVLAQAAGHVIADAFEKAVGVMSDFAKYAVSSGIEYESSMAKVNTIMDSTAMSSEDMSNAILDASSKFGTGASDIANSVYDVISATGDTANAVSLVEQATMLAKGGFAETGDAVSVLTTAINAYGMEMTDSEHIADSLITVQNLGVTTVGELASNMGKAIATGAAYGVSLENLETGYIAMTKSGISTAESTTMLSAMMSELGKEGSGVSDILQEKTGKSFGELMESGMSLGDVLGILNDSVDGNSEALMNLWGSQEAGKAASSIVNQGLEEFNGWLNEVENSSGATQTAFDTMSSTTGEKINQLKTSFQNFATKAIQPAIDKANEFLPAITEMIQGLDPNEIFDKLQQLAPIIAGIGTAIGIVTAAIGMKNAVEAIEAAMRAEKVATLPALIAAEWAHASAALAAVAPYLLVAAAIAAVIAIIVVCVTHWEEIKAKVTEVAGAIKSAVEEKFNAVKTKVKEVVDSVKNKIDEWREKLDAVKTKVEDMVGTVEDKFEAAKKAVKDAMEAIKGFLSGELKFPHIAVPHFKITGGVIPWGIGGAGSPPKVSVDWYRKAMDNAMVLDKPTIFGMANNGQLLGAGEAGREVVTGESHLMDMIREANGGNESAYLLRQCVGLMEDILDEVEKGHVIKIGERDFGRAVRAYG